MGVAIRPPLKMKGHPERWPINKEKKKVHMDG